MTDAASIRPGQRWFTMVDGARLQQLRHQHGLSAAELAGKAGVGVSTVTRLERTPRSTCRSRTLARLAAAVGEVPATLTAEAADVAAAFDQVEMDFDPDGGFRYGGGRNLSKLEQEAKAGDDEAAQ